MKQFHFLKCYHLPMKIHKFFPILSCFVFNTVGKALLCNNPETTFPEVHGASQVGGENLCSLSSSPMV